MARLESLVIHCRQPAGLAAFYSAVLGLPIDSADAAALANGTFDPTEAVLIGDRDGLHLWLVPGEADRTDSPGVHFDIRLDDVAERDLFVSLGAQHRWFGPDQRWEVLADPEGNLFCVFPPIPRQALS